MYNCLNPLTQSQVLMTMQEWTNETTWEKEKMLVIGFSLLPTMFSTI